MSLPLIDTVTWQDIPVGSDAALYIDGHYTAPPEAFAKFPTALQIVVNPSDNRGDIYDYELGNGAPNASLCRQWLLLRHSAGHPYPVIYVQKSNWASVQAACAGLNFPFGYWIAEWNGISHDAGGDATQWADPRYPVAGGKNLDFSTIYRGPWLERFGAQPQGALMALNEQQLDELYNGVINNGKVLNQILKTLEEPVDNTNPDNLSGGGLPWAANQTLQILGQIQKMMPSVVGSMSQDEIKAVASEVLAQLKIQLAK